MGQFGAQSDNPIVLAEMLNGLADVFLVSKMPESLVVEREHLNIVLIIAIARRLTRF
jgi:hypothetical protein